MRRPNDPRRIGKALHDDIRRRRSIFQGGDLSNQLVPLLNDDVEIDDAAEQRLQRTVIRVAINAAGAALKLARQPRSEFDIHWNRRLGSLRKGENNAAHHPVPRPGTFLDNEAGKGTWLHAVAHHPGGGAQPDTSTPIPESL